MQENHKLKVILSYKNEFKTSLRYQKQKQKQKNIKKKQRVINQAYNY